MFRSHSKICYVDLRTNSIFDPVPSTYFRPPTIFQVVMSKRITEEVCLKVFKKMPDADGKGLWKCQCGKILKRQEGSGWANLRMHIISQHPDASEQFEETPENGQSTLLDPSLGLINKKAQNVFAWLDWVCNDLCVTV